MTYTPTDRRLNPKLLVLSINHKHYAGKNADAINCLPHTKKIVY